MPLAPVLFIVFLVLKLVGVIAWSWVWVTAPLWIPFVIFLLFAAFGISVVGFGAKKAAREHEEFRKRHGFR